MNDYAYLQQDLKRLVAWSEGNGIQLKVKKSHAMMLRRIQNTFNYFYTINLKVVTKEKDLGDIFETSLGFISISLVC